MMASYFTAPLWTSGWRPFFLLGALYGPLVLVYWLAASTGLVAADPVIKSPFWHQHEMIFGFGFAIIAGFVTTALPSWARTSETEGGELALITACWLLGRIAFWCQDLLPFLLVVICDQLLVPALIVVLWPKLLKAYQRRYLGLIPILLGFWFGNLTYYLGVEAGDPANIQFGLLLGLYSMIFLYSIVAGTLTPIFTETALQQKGERCQYQFKPLIEVFALVSLLVLIVCDLSGYSDQLTAAAALATAVVHGWRMSRWNGLRALRFPLIWTMQLAYLWLVLAFVFNALYHVGWIQSSSVWVHAYTVGALALKQLSILTRVALKHTGRSLQVHWLMLTGFALAASAIVLRELVVVMHLSDQWLVFSALLWALPFLIWLALYGAFCWRPSLPRKSPSK